MRLATTQDYHRGRREQRTLELTTDLTAFLASTSPWPEIAQVGRLTRTVTTTHAAAPPTQQQCFVVTTLPPDAADPACVLRLLRQHWRIENGLHYVRDVTFGEDRSQVRTAHAPQVVAALRNLALTLIRRTGATAIAATRRALAFDPARAFALVLSSPPTS